MSKKSEYKQNNSTHNQQKKNKKIEIPIQIIPKKTNIVEYSKHQTPKNQITSIHIFDLFDF
jgi:hypothetical protein